MPTDTRNAWWWEFAPACPPAWEDHLERIGGGFFHAPVGLLAGAPMGDPVFATLHAATNGTSPLGLAIGVRSGCRYSLGNRHVYFPTLPALAACTRPADALCALVRALRQRGAAEVRMDSFDAEWTPDDPSASNGHGRCEYVLVLGSDSDTLIAAGGQTHRRCFRRGEREGWELESLAGARAREAVQRVQKEAAERADGWGRAFTPGAPAHAAEAALTLPSSGWGTSVFAAAADGTLLAAALVGWANRRAFYVSGGSTPAGYRDGAAVWLHWKIAHYLQGQGFTTYNLGGTPAGADDPSHPAHGLYRFKTGFGCEVRPRTGAHWVLSPLHLKAHRVTQRFRGVAVRPQALVDVR